jgi:16S rRNA (cytosine967-C5)-methyltransferase
MVEPAADPLAARALAMRVLRRVERDGAYADVALNAALQASALPPRDRAFAARLVYGTLAWQGRLDWHVTTLARRPAAGLDPALRIVLRLGLYQLLLLDRVPVHAAVSTSVDLAKAAAPAGARLVNAVLRRAARERHALPLPDAEAEPIAHLAVALSHPEWLVRRWAADRGSAELRALLAADNEAAPTVLRARHGRRDALLEALARAGVTASPGRFAPDAVTVDTAAPHALAPYASGGCSVQSEASQLVACLVAPEPGMRVLDACAAPGGKATYLAELMHDRGLVVALDRRPRRARSVAAAARRLGIRGVAAVVADARRAGAVLAGARFDRILVDAPCTGLGTLRAHPELRWTRGPDDPRRLAVLQREILEATLPLLQAGGALVYATCTMTREENDDLVERLLADHAEMALEHAAASLPPEAAMLVDEGGALRTSPHRHGLDGFYAVRLVQRR